MFTSITSVPAALCPLSGGLSRPGHSTAMPAGGMADAMVAAVTRWNGEVAAWAFRSLSVWGCPERDGVITLSNHRSAGHPGHTLLCIGAAGIVADAEILGAAAYLRATAAALTWAYPTEEERDAMPGTLRDALAEHRGSMEGPGWSPMVSRTPGGLVWGVQKGRSLYQSSHTDHVTPWNRCAR